MKRVYFLQQRTFEGFTYHPDREYKISESNHAKLMQNFPRVLRDFDEAEADVSPAIIIESAPESVTTVVLEELVIESESSEIEDSEPAVDVGIEEILEIDEVDMPGLNLPGVAEKAVEVLSAAGFNSNDEVVAASDEELRAIDGIGPGYLVQIRAALK